MLNNIKYLLSTFLLLLTLGVNAQSPVTQEINQSLKTGNADLLGKHLAQQVDLSINGKESLYSQAQTIELVRSFFARNKAQNFEIKHANKNRQAQASFKIGILKTSNGNFRVTYLLKRSPKGPRIQRLKFDKIPS